MSNQRTVYLEEQISHLSRVMDDLSDIVARQETEIAQLNRRVRLLMERAADTEMAEGGTAMLADQKPPHW